MKKLIIFFVLFVTIFLYGCENVPQNQNLEILTNFNATAKANIDKKEYEFEIYRVSEQACSVKFLLPKTLTGITFCCENDKHQVLLGDLMCESNKQFLNENSFLNDIINIMNILKNQDELRRISSTSENSTYEYKKDNFNFEVIIANNGFINSINVPNKNMTVEFTPM